VLAWQGGGSIGSGALSAVGASPWQFGLAVGGTLGVAAAATVTALGALAWWRARPLAASIGAASIGAASIAAASVGAEPDADADDDDDDDDEDEDEDLDQDDRPTVVLTAVSDAADEGETPEPDEGAALAG
jgi:hypothetical protein